MKFGVHLPNSGGGAVYPDSLAEYEIIRDIALESEKLGYDSIWVNEHVTSPNENTSSESKFYEPLTLLSTLASMTSKVLLGTAIVILPFRDPFIISKEICTLSEFSNYRFVFGVGPGRFEREYTAQGKDWENRVKIMDEQVRLIRELVAGKNVEFVGKYYSCSDFTIRPSASSIPFILGGSGPQSIKRAARICDGIMPGHITVEDATKITKLANGILNAPTAYRKKKSFKFYSEIILSIDNDREKAKSKFYANTYVKRVPYATDLSTKALIGAPGDIVEKIADYERAGVEELVLIFADETEEDFINSMNLFAREVFR